MLGRERKEGPERRRYEGGGDMRLLWLCARISRAFALLDLLAPPAG